VLVHNTSICDDAIAVAKRDLSAGKSIDEIQDNLNQMVKNGKHTQKEVDDALAKILDPNWKPGGTVAPKGADVSTTFGEARPRGLAHSPLREGEIDQYRYFSNRPGDGLEGHEVWQSANTSAYGIGGRIGAIGGRNPSIAIATQNHRQIVNKLQSEMIPDAASMSALDNIKANMSVLREAQRRGVGITDRQINDAGRKAVRFYMRLLKEGAIRE
jgi:hypothetical protein